jgi:single-strand DNA-binding protein
MWGKLAELAEKQLNKGSEIAIDGKLVNRNYTDKNGVLRYSTEILANGVIIMGKA